MNFKSESKRSQRSFSTQKTYLTIVGVFFFIVLIGSLPEQCASKSSRKRDRSKSLPCRTKTSEWSKCTKACGMGISRRVKTKGKCEPRRETRLCMVRLCEETFIGRKSNGKHRCARHKKAPKKQHLTYIDGKSEKKYKMKFCGSCSDNTKCCTPVKTKTKKVRFRRRDGSRFSKMMMFIRKCRCHSYCDPIVNNMMFTISLYGDMHREDGEANEELTQKTPEK